jgi:V8-like Glu-specific endopeptidase
MPNSIEDHHRHYSHTKVKIKLILLFLISIFIYQSLAIGMDNPTGCASVSISIVSKIIPGLNSSDSTIYSNQCSATFIKFNNKPYLITAYHCIHGEDDNKMASPSSISVNERRGCEEYPFSKIKIKNILVHPTQMNLTVKDDFSFKTPLDMALLELDLSEIEFSQIPKMNIVDNENQLFTQLGANESNSISKSTSEFYIHLNYAGYPVEPPFNFGDFKFYPEIKSFISVELKSIFLFENIYGGMSGGPVYKSKNGVNFLVGIISTSLRQDDKNILNRAESALVYAERLKNFIPINGHQ